MPAKGFYFPVLVFISVFVCSTCVNLPLIEKAYEKGVLAYTGERWSECIVQFEESLHLYKLYKTIVVSCRLQCNSKPYESDITENIGDLKMYERFFNTRNCLNNCQDEGFRHVNMKIDLDDSVMFNMQTRKPYEYLHLCYFQMNALPKAASAVYTFLAANPEDESMQNNLNYYIQQPEVDVNDIVDLLSEDYTDLYKLGLDAYRNKNWGNTVANMEEVLTGYLDWEDSCRVECERQPEQEWSPEIIITISNNIASLLHCRQQCQDKLKPLGYKSGGDFLADVLNYLQISYYRSDKVQEAAQTVASYLALMPHDEVMLENKNIYSTLTAQDSFIERDNIVYYWKRDNYEKKLLNFFHQRNGDNVNFNSK